MEIKVSMQSFDTLGNKPNDTVAATPRAPETPPAGAQTAFCPHCQRELSGTGTRDLNGCPVIEWRCSEHGYIVNPEFEGGA
jgi:hypothetical protein